MAVADEPPPSTAGAQDAPHDALIEAAAWRIRLDDQGVETSPAFEAWRALRGNAEAWMQVQALWRVLEEVASTTVVRTHRLAALERLRPRRAPWIWAGMAAALGAILVAAAPAGRYATSQTLSTPSAARRVAVLADGTRVTLDADSRIHVRLAARERLVELDQGQARFDVAPDADRPFRVRVDDREVVALGTSFNVERTRHAVIVTLLAGRASVGERPSWWRRGEAAPTALSAGERMSAPAFAQDGGRVVPVSLVRATAWESGLLVFDDEPLAQALERVSRYSRAPITAGDRATAALRISGVFEADDTDAFVSAVSRYFDLKAARGERGETILRSRQQNRP